MTVSMVSRCYETDTHPISFTEIWDTIKTGKHGLKEKITQIRNRYEAEKDITGSVEKAKKAVAELKQQLPGFLPSGSFTKRESGSLSAYSGLLCADLDSLGDQLTPVRELLKLIPTVRAMALSPSGDGLKVFFNVVNDPSRHEDSFRAIRDEIRNSLNVEIDEKCKDPSRICFFTYDPDLWLRESGNEIFEPAPPLPRPVPAPPSPRVEGALTREQVAYNLLGELTQTPEKGGYFCRCPGEAFHTASTTKKHTIVYLEGAPTLFCQHQSCAHVVESFNKVLRSEIGKAEFKPTPPRASPVSKNGAAEPEEIPWIDHLNKSAVTSVELSGLQITPRKKILGEWFCEADLGFFFGPRGAGKTFFSLGFVQAITTGSNFGEWEASEPMKVLYVDGEMPPDSMKSRCEALHAVNENLIIVNHSILFDRTNKTINVTNPSIQDALSEYCLAKDVKVLMLDNLSTLGVGMKENDADSWEMVNVWLLDLRRRGIAVVIIHHSGRSGHMRGTSRREDNVFWIIGIDEVKKETESVGAHFISRFTKPSRNTPNDIADFEWHFSPDPITGLITIGYKICHSLTMFRAVIESGVTKPSEIAKVMRVEDYQVSRMAHKAIGAGWLERVNRGEYSIVEGK